MGTNSFKLHIIQADPSTGKFLSPPHQGARPILGLSTASPSPLISPHAQSRAISALRKFFDVLNSSRIHDCRVVATSVVRDAANRKEFLDKVEEEVGMSVEVLSGEDEEKFVRNGELVKMREHVRNNVIQESGLVEKVSSVGFEEIFGMLGIDVSGYALGEGLIAEKLAKAGV
ncbi:hypothetical protein QQ045_010416 [Rhodiola kirilowii]